MNIEGRDWWWKHFDTHPLYSQKADELYANPKERRPKVMYKLCRTAWIINKQHRDRDTLQQGQINEVRIQDRILTYDRVCPQLIFPEFARDSRRMCMNRHMHYVFHAVGSKARRVLVVSA
jgi:hypothetical protein